MRIAVLMLLMSCEARISEEQHFCKVLKLSPVIEGEDMRPAPICVIECQRFDRWVVPVDCDQWEGRQVVVSP